MKRNKLLFAMGFAGAVLMGCNSSSSDSNNAEITAIDGYIVNGLVAMTCSNGTTSETFTGRTNENGVASINTAGYSGDECTSSITGDDLTYDWDKPGTPWKNTMKALPGQNVINPFTDIAALLVENDPTLDSAAALEEVYLMLGITDGRDLFVDYGTNNPGRLAEMSVLAESVFATMVELKAAAPSATAKNLVSLYQEVLPQVSAEVETYIAANPGVDLTKVVFTPDITLPATIEFDADGNVSTDLSGLAVTITTVAKPPAYTGTTGATGATGAATVTGA